MRTKKLFVSILAFVFLLVPAITRAQQVESTATPEVDAKTEIREKAVSLLESLASQLSTLQSPENRARIGANIADSLWIHDEQRARILFRAVASDIQAGLQFRDSEDPRDRHTQLVFLKLRLDTIERITKRDPELALEFLRTTEPVLEKPLNAEILERIRASEMHLATKLAASNPEISLKLARQALAGDGVPWQFLQVLRQLLRKHRPQGLILYREALDKLRGAKLLDNWALSEFATSLAVHPQPPLVDEALYRDLMNILKNSLKSNRCNQRDESEWGSSYYSCDRIRNAVEQMARVGNGSSRQARSSEYGEYDLRVGSVWAEIESVASDGNIDELLALREQYPSFSKNIYIRAFSLALQSGDTELAAKLAAEFTGEGEEQVRRQMMAQMERREKQEAITEADIAEAQLKLQEMPDSLAKVPRLLDLAKAVPTNRGATLKLLNQALAITDAAKPGSDQIGSYLQLAALYSKAKSDRGLAIVEALMPRLNELVDAAIKLDGVETGYVRDGEWNMSGEGNLGSILTLLSQSAGDFAWYDFDRAVNVASQFGRNEIRMMAQLRLAQSIVSGPTKRPR